MSKSYLSLVGPNLARRGGTAFERMAFAVVTLASPFVPLAPLRERQRRVVEAPAHGGSPLLLP